MGLHVGEIVSLLIPLLSFLPQALSLIYNSAHFLLVTLALVFYFYAYPLSPLQNLTLERLRKYSVLICGSWLTIVLTGEIEAIFTDVYSMDYSFQILFIVKIVLILVNAEIGIAALSRYRHEMFSLPL